MYNSYERSELPRVLHRRWSEALLSVAEAQVQHAPTTFMLIRASLGYINGSGSSLRVCASRLVVHASRRIGHPFAASSSKELSQKIEFVFSASPETIRRERASGV
jgi:hypothetical protein